MTKTLAIVTQCWRGGAVDYKNVPELAGVDLERYRGTGRPELGSQFYKVNARAGRLRCRPNRSDMLPAVITWHLRESNRVGRAYLTY